MNGAIAAGEKNSLPVRNSEAGSARHYPKGASVLHMLQHVMGRDNFRRGIKLYLDRHAFDGVMTVDLEKAMLDATGMNMDWFFDQWIYRGGEPHYKVSRQSVTAGTEFTVEQIHKMEPTVGTFRMPVDFAVYYTDGSVSRLTVNIDKLFQKVTVPNPGNKDIAFTLFDEGSHILKKLTFEKSAEECLKQFLGARDMLDRYDALIALSKIPFEKKKDALAAAFAKETHKSIRAEITKQWLQNNEDLNFANQAIKARQTEVRRAVIEGLTVNDNTLAIFETALKDSSYFIIESALMKLWEAMPDESKRTRYLQAITGVDGYTHNLKIRYLELSTEVFPDMKGNAIMMLTDYCSDKYEFRTRILAMQALQRLNVCNEVVVKNLYTCILNFNSRLAGPAKDVLQYFKQQTACQKILKSTLETGGYSAEQKRSIKQTVGL
jgi:aminopeptidase N